MRVCVRTLSGSWHHDTRINEFNNLAPLAENIGVGAGFTRIRRRILGSPGFWPLRIVEVPKIVGIAIALTIPIARYP